MSWLEGRGGVAGEGRTEGDEGFKGDGLRDVPG